MSTLKGVDSPTSADLETTLLAIRVRTTMCRLALALAQARGYAETWGMDQQAATWHGRAEVLKLELQSLREPTDVTADDLAQAA